jgi:hypothetical protein
VGRNEKGKEKIIERIGHSWQEFTIHFFFFPHHISPHLERWGNEVGKEEKNEKRRIEYFT